MATAMPSRRRRQPADHPAQQATGSRTQRFRLLAPLLALLATPAPGPVSRRRRFFSEDEDEAQSGLIPGIVLFGVGLIIAIIITVVVLQFYPLLTSEVNTAQTDPNSTTSATNSLDLLPLVIVIGLVFLSLGTMFAGLSMIVKATKGIGSGG